MKVTTYDLTANKGVPHEERKGKTHWPDQVTIEMSLWDAWNMADSILQQIRNLPGDLPAEVVRLPVNFCVVGTLKKTDTDDI